MRLTIAVAACACVAALASHPHAQNRDIVLGMSAAFSGPSAALGTELYRGAQAYFAGLNAAGGVNGRRIVIRALDDAYDPVRAIRNTIQLVEQEKIRLLFGYVGTPTVVRVLPLIRRYGDRGAVLLFPFTGAEPQRRAPYEDLTLNLRASYFQETAGLVDNFVVVGRKRIAVFYQADAYGRSGWDGVRRALTTHGLTMAGEASYRRGTPVTASMREQVEAIAAGKPDAVIAVGSYAACAAFVRDAVDAGLTVPIANVSFVGSESLLDLLTDAGRKSKKDYTSKLINSQVVPSYEDVDLPAVREYRDTIARQTPPLPAGVSGSAGPMRPSFVGFEGFLDAKLIVEITRRATGEDPESFRAAVLKTNGTDLGIGVPVQFTDDDNQGLDQVYYTVVVNGRFQPLRDWQAWAK